MMKNTGKMKLTTSGDREIVITRDLDAPRKLVWDALTKPELIRRWLLGPPGWSMPVCEVDLRVGGAYRYVWERESGTSHADCPGQPTRMGMGGEFREIIAPQRLVATEKFDDAWYPGDALDTTELIERNGKTTMTLTVQYQSREAREAVLKTPMEQGMAMGYDRLAELLASQMVARTK